MRIIIDLPDGLAARGARAVEAGEYPSFDALSTTAIGLLLDRAAELRSLNYTSPTDIETQVTLPVGQYVYDMSPDASWLWGMINRVFPLKLAARTCAELSKKGPIRVHTLHSAFAARGASIGQKLRTHDEKSAHTRNERLSVGLPYGPDDQKAQVRFAHQFVGRRSGSGAFVGGAFETGLIGPVEPGRDWIAPTEKGWAFSDIVNRVLDGGVLGSSALDEEEREHYLLEIAPLIPAERNALSSILTVLAQGPLDVATLSNRVQSFQRGQDAEAVRATSRSGALARFTETGALERTPLGRSATYQTTPLGVSARAKLDNMAGLR